MKTAFLAVTALAVAAPAAPQTTSTAPSLPAKAAAPSAVVAKPPSGPVVPPPKAATPVPRRRPVSPSPAERRVRAANHAATLEPATGSYLNAVQVFPYSDGVIYHVLTAPEQVTDVALQPGEGLVAVAAGDTVRWVIGDTTSGGNSSGSGEPKRTHVLIKPFTAGLATNVIITTDRRTYHLALSSTAHTAMAALSWTYPQDALIALKAAAEAARAAQPVATGLAVDQLHFGYAISGDTPAWRPLRAFDDGRQTFIEFPASLTQSEAPPLFLVDAKGKAELVNYRVQGRYYVVDRLFDAAELRLGLKHQDVVRISRTGEATSKRRPS
ncbi:MULTISPECIES: P-type conjugative transfer protein TrbG [unclassified Novosphingobium]|uniref:P-type conjugative transfer protein TrbG n=1 Tax=unclassified Novosphingobium TaxID=2644732 RepID=UPI000D30FDA0|nr:MULTISPECIES: P-type conjugative transfer protein TrbG [unclassified Novosphingobium]PTR08746.1 type IV secretion system protein VirB9 [Novosphingobium sp. GV055]PUB01658.1 type IV secretion system protein VirB9 [Novosphingobium sp. GV061]PUB17630.1 type IV secretion system protein VirB9 [Novosphingobium sp. GV079]PUB40324.1 type IV secretion system protein VirB9 [Novosphingobium sp. GV027]